MADLAALDAQLPIAAGTRTRCRGDVAVPKRTGIRAEISNLIVARLPNADVAEFGRALLDLAETLLDLGRPNAAFEFGNMLLQRGDLRIPARTLLFENLGDSRDHRIEFCVCDRLRCIGLALRRSKV